MKRAVAFTFIVCCAVAALTLAEGKKHSKPSVTMSPPDEFTAAKTTPTTPNTTTTTPNATTTTPKTTPTTPNTTTTTPKTTTTTTPKTTTTTTPKTTTTTPKTTTTTTTTTTPKTTTTTTTPPPPKPTPPANLTVGNYTLMANKTVMCLRAQMALQVRLSTPKANGTFIVQPKMTKVEGGCKDTTANLTLVFKEGFISFMFNKSTANKTVYVDALSFAITYPSNKGANTQFTANNKSTHLFAAKVGHSYSCTRESLYMGNGLYLDVNQDKMQAFNLTKSNDFGNPEPCPADRPDYRVAIAVGVTLLVLIVIVVVAYLLGRRRRTDGYQSL